MLDSFDRPITYLRLSVTELCDLRCRYCMPEQGICKLRHDQLLSEDEMIRVVRAAAQLGVTKLRITGGEPLTKPNILSICRRACEVPGISDTGLTTNAVRLDEMAVPLREAGIRRVNISLDTLDPKKIRLYHPARQSGRRLARTRRRPARRLRKNKNQHGAHRRL